MPDSNSRADAELSKYDAMSTEELQQILREDASKTEGEESDTEALFYVMEVLAKRRRAKNEGKTPEEALESFKKNYWEENDSSEIENIPTVQKRNPGFRRWVSGLVAVAAMLVLIVSTSFTARAFGFDLWDVIVKWTQETFHFGYVGQEDNASGPEHVDVTPYLKLQTMLDEHNVEAALVPTWIPEGYVEIEVETFETPKQRQFFSVFQCDEKVIKIWIADYLDTGPVQIEQSDSVVEAYEAAGVTYYIFNDNEQLRAAWLTQSYECYITGTISITELKNMIDSIGKG